MDEKLISQVVSHFFTNQEILNIKPVPSGHIHKTFKISFHSRSIILQKLNTDIFKNPEILDENINKITQRIPKTTVALLIALDGRTLIEKDGYWRAFA